MTRPFLATLAVATLATAAIAAPTLERLWETEARLKVPESVLLDGSRQVLYVSNIVGTQPWEKDGAGSIGRVSLEGEIRDVDWVSGLHAPKGLALTGGRLVVADIDRVVFIDPDAGRIVETIPVPDAARLNDVSAAPDGTVYVTDSGTGRVFALRDGRVSVRSEAFKSPNGVLATADALYVLDQETLHQVGPDGEAQPLVRGLVGHVDGIEQTTSGDFIVSCWGGIVYHATRDGTVITLLDTRDAEINAADIDYDADRRIVYVPTFWKNTVAAYRLRGN